VQPGGWLLADDWRGAGGWGLQLFVLVQEREECRVLGEERLKLIHTGGRPVDDPCFAEVVGNPVKFIAHGVTIDIAADGRMSRSAQL
jgi:hypothetical protein